MCVNDAKRTIPSELKGSHSRRESNITLCHPRLTGIQSLKLRQPKQKNKKPQKEQKEPSPVRRIGDIEVNVWLRKNLLNGYLFACYASLLS